MHDLVQAAGGTILRERYLPVGSTDVAFMIREIEEMAPDFVFNTLIGESCYAFYRAYHELARRNNRFEPANRPILSCTLSEPELLAIGLDAAAGHISSSVYFHGLEQPENLAFVRAFRTRVGAGRVTSADSEAAYITIQLLAASIREAGTDQVAAVKRAAYRQRLTAPQGTVWIDPENNHAWLTPRIGLATPDGAFDIQWEAGEPCRPDPYLAFPPQPVAAANGPHRRGAPNLRLVRCP
jgi:branched-chain amino acid transport system substrate-binding protein